MDKLNVLQNLFLLEKEKAFRKKKKVNLGKI